MTKEEGTQSSTRGGCLCGAVTFEVKGDMRPVWNCHCGQCRRTHGHFAAYTNVPTANLKMVQDRGLKWFESSGFARRGFCGDCGASLFWERLNSGTISVSAGTLEAPVGLTTGGHIFVADKGDYYEIADGLPAYPGTMSQT